MSNADIIPMGLIKTVFSSEHYPVLFRGKQTDDAALRLGAQIVPYTKDYDYVRSIYASGLPEDYQGDTLERIEHYIDSAAAKNFDEMTPKKKSGAAVLLDIVENQDDITLFHDNLDQTYISVPSKGGGERTLSLAGKEAKLWLKRLYYETTGSPLNSQAFSDALANINAKALYDGEQKTTSLRIARHKKSIYWNRGDKEGTVIKIESEGYKVIKKSPVSFLCSGNMSALPLPEGPDPCLLAELQDLFAVDDSTFHRILAFLISSIKPEGPYLCLIVQGEQGSGKSYLTSLIKESIDPSQASKLRLPTSERELMIMAAQFHLTVFDNISGISNNLSDALCTLATGGGFAARQLYTDEELKIFVESRPFILNGISGITHRADLLDRSLSINLPSMSPEKRKTESELKQKFREIHPYLIDFLLRVTSTALKRYDEVNAPNDIRMADTARWLIAAEPETGLPKNSLINAIRQSQNEIVTETMERNSLAVALHQMLEENGVFDGTVGELLSVIGERRFKHDRFFPTTPAQLSKELDRLIPL